LKPLLPLLLSCLGFCVAAAVAGPTWKVAACQIFTDGSVAENEAAIAKYLAEAAEGGLDLVVFPECALTVYSKAADYTSRLDAAEIERAIEALRATCRQLGIAAGIGTAYYDGVYWRNGLVIIDKDGREAGRYIKTFDAGEKWARNPDRLQMFRLGGEDVCAIICHDIRYPELVRLPAAAGAVLCLYSSCESGMDSPHKFEAYRAMPISRATENGIFLVMANAPAVRGKEGAKNVSHGNSKIVHPNGTVLAEADHYFQGLLTAEIDLREADRGIANRVAGGQSPLREWMRDGVGLVEEAE